MRQLLMVKQQKKNPQQDYIVWKLMHIVFPTMMEQPIGITTCTQSKKLTQVNVMDEGFIKLTFCKGITIVGAVAISPIQSSGLEGAGSITYI